MESMELRLLLQGCNVVGSAMTVTGNASGTGDDIKIQKDGSSKLLVLNGVSEINHANCYVSDSSITSITVNADNDDDKVEIFTGVSAANVTINGGNGNDTLTGGDSGDVINGDAGNDSLVGGAGADSLDGGSNDDILVGGAGADTLNGGNGNDTADYSASQSNLTITLDTDPHDGAAGENDYVQTTIETVLGGSGNDFIVGGSNDERLEGRGGNDTLRGGLGADILVGGGSLGDWVDYSDRTSTAVTIDLTTPASTNGASGEGDSIQGIYNAIGGGGADTITGDSNANHLIGGAGNDTIVGGAGNDTLSGGDGTDSLSGGDGEDSISGGAGGDIVFGGADNDTLEGGLGSDCVYGEGGNDVLYDNTQEEGPDGVADLLDGGTGTDSHPYTDSHDTYLNFP